MLPLLVLIPVATSAILGLTYLLTGQNRRFWGAPGTAIFVAAVYLQFMTRHALAGMLLQIALALCLAVWRKANRP